MRTILISGASRGIGRSIALKALEDGYRISLGLRDLDSIKGSKLDPAISGSESIFLSHYEATNSKSSKDWVNSTMELLSSDILMPNHYFFLRRTYRTTKKIVVGQCPDQNWLCF